MNIKSIQCLSGNALKIIACVIMLIDHIGHILLPGVQFLRIIGRLALPIFAFFIAEGCKYTKNKPKYLLNMSIFGIAMMLVQYLVTGVVLGNIMVCFALSILIIYTLQELKKSFFSKNANNLVQIGWLVLLLIVIAFVLFSCQFLRVDYGFFGVMVPVLVSLVDFKGLNVGKLQKLDNLYVRLFLLLLSLLALSINLGGIQYYCLLALPLLLLYNGERGKWNIKYYFYIFYPAHICLLWGIAFVL